MRDFAAAAPGAFSADAAARAGVDESCGIAKER
jgi:hypothetical protein